MLFRSLIACKLNPGHRGIADTAFTVGIMSLMDTLFGQTMESIFDQISVADEVREALLYRTGKYGEMLQLAEYVECIEEAGRLVAPTLRQLGLSIEELNVLQLEAFAWSNSISAGA